MILTGANDANDFKSKQRVFTLKLYITLYKHPLIHLQIDQINNIHHTHSRSNIDKTARSFRNIHNRLLIVSLISKLLEECITKPHGSSRHVKDAEAKLNVCG